jgi:hypothetical protein
MAADQVLSRRRLGRAKLPAMTSNQQGSIVASILGIVICGSIGGVSAWAIVTALGWSGTPGSIVAAIIGMVVATAAWAAGTALLRKLGALR